MVGFCHAHPTVLAVLFVTVCVALHVLGFVALCVSTSGVGVNVRVVSGCAVAVVTAVAATAVVGLADGVFVAFGVAIGVWLERRSPVLVGLTCPNDPLFDAPESVRALCH